MKVDVYYFTHTDFVYYWTYSTRAEAEQVGRTLVAWNAEVTKVVVLTLD